MKKLFGGFVLVTVLAVSAIALYAQQSVAGKWIMSIQGVSMRMELVQEGEKISGNIDSPHGVIPLTGEFSKGKLVLSGVATDSHPIQFTGTGTLRDDGSLSGNISVNLMEMSFTAVRSTGE